MKFLWIMELPYQVSASAITIKRPLPLHEVSIIGCFHARSSVFNMDELSFCVVSL